MKHKKMAGQMNIMENRNIVDLTTDDCNEAILPKIPVNSGDSDVKPPVITLMDISDTEDDVEFLGTGVRYIPVITISDSGVFEDDNINNSNTGSYTLKANSTITVKNLSEKSEGCKILEGKSCFTEKTESQQMRNVRTSERAKKAVTETVMGSASRNKRHYRGSSEHSRQVQNIKKEVLTEGGSQNKICKRSIRNVCDENGAKVHRKKPKIKVRIILKKPGSGINTQQIQDTLVTDEVKTEDSRSPKPYSMTSEGVTRKGMRDISSKTVNQGILTQSLLKGSENTVNKEYLDLKKESCSSEISYKINVCKKDTISKSVAEGGIGKNVSDANKRLSKIEDAHPWNQTESNAGHEDKKKIREIHEETSSGHPEESSALCSRLAVHSAVLPLHKAQDERDGLHNKNIEATILDERNEDSVLEVQLLAARMTIKDCESQAVYAVPLLRLPVQKQAIYFSPAYIEAFLKKIRHVFSVEKFLHAIPDPFNYFRNEIIKETRYSDECLAVMYLKSKYRRIPFPDIAFIFEKNRCSLTLTCEELDMWKSSWKRTIRKIGLGCGCPKPHELSMRFIHEVTFIENKSIIESHLQSKKRKKATEFEIAKLGGELQQCGHCGVSDLLIEDMAPCSMSHMFCKICIQNAVDSRLLRCENPFSCLNRGCKWLFSMDELKKAVKPVTFSSLLHIRHLKEMEAAGVKVLETCPYCGFADIPSKDDEVFCCLNPDCMRETCRQCKGPSHTPYPCVMALKPQVEMPRLVTNRCDQYQNQFQSTETQQNIGIVEEKSLVLQQPQPLMQCPQQPLMHHPLEPQIHHQGPLMAPQDDPLMRYPQQPLVHHLQSPAVQQSWSPFIPEQQMMQHYQPSQWRH